jgi:EF hand
MMMVSNNGYNLPQNGYYNPPKPPVTTKNYQEAVKYGDSKEYGGNGDGKVSASELTSIKKVFDYASDYYKNMYQQSGDQKYMAWSEHYSRDAKATDNVSQNFSAFQQADATVKDGVTDKGITTLAGQDGRASSISIQDLAKAQFPNFVDNAPPMNYGQPMYNQPPYGGGQPMYNQPPQYGGQPPLYDRDQSMQALGQARNETDNSIKSMYGLLAGLDPNSPTAQGLQQEIEKAKKVSFELDNQQQRLSSQPQQYGGRQPMMYNQPPYGGGQPMMYGQPQYNGQAQYGGGQSQYTMGMPFPAPKDLTYLKAKADNAQAWDGAAFAQGAVSRESAVDLSRDGQISYAEAPDSPQTRALWDALSGPDGTINPQELAAAILSVDGDANGTVTAQEADKFLQDTMAKLAKNPNSVISTYNNFQAGASAFGLDKFLKNPEAAYALQFEQQLNAQEAGQTKGDTLGLLQQAEQARLNNQY